nr:uncharacterized protein LOC127489262 isoform X2 [Oryctolagus cuniculus]
MLARGKQMRAWRWLRGWGVELTATGVLPRRQTSHVQHAWPVAFPDARACGSFQKRLPLHLRDACTRSLPHSSPVPCSGRRQQPMLSSAGPTAVSGPEVTRVTSAGTLTPAAPQHLASALTVGAPRPCPRGLTVERG